MSENKHTPEPWDNRTYIDRFWSRVNVSWENDCWEWTRGTTSDGYGVFHFGHSSIRSHRFSYQQHNGKITEHECVLHSCDNPRCVNPKHLWIGTRAENNADKEAKKRGVHPVQSSGESNSNATLTTPEVIAAKVMARKGLPQARIAKLLGVSTATICLIVNGERRQDETERRVSACVNACAGIPTDQLESGEARYVRNELADIYALEKRRDELLAALEKGGHSLREISLWDKTTAKDVAMAKAAYAEVKAAIASVKGYGQPEKSAKTEVPAIVFFPAGSLGEEIEEEGRPA